MNTVELPPLSTARVWVRPVLKAVILLAVLLAAVWFMYASSFRHTLKNLTGLNERVAAIGSWAPLVFTLATAGLVAMGCPRLLLSSIAGAVFGFWSGLLWSQIGTLLGSYLTFLFVRWGGQELVLRRWPRLKHLPVFLEHRAVVFVIITRQLPVTAFFLNLMLGVMPIRHRHFLLGTVIGNLPEAVPCTLIGSGVLHETAAHGAWQIGLAMGLLALVWIGTGLYLRRSRAAARVRETVASAVMEKE